MNNIFPRRILTLRQQDIIRDLNTGSDRYRYSTTKKSDFNFDKIPLTLTEINKADLYLKWYDRHRNGMGDAAGVDHICVKDLTRNEVAELMRRIAKEIKSGTFQPPAMRQVDIRKPDGGTRTLSVPTAAVRIVAGTINHVLQPKIHSHLPLAYHGNMPRRSTLTLFAEIHRKVRNAPNQYLLQNDVRQAYDNVRLRDTREVLTQYIPDAPLLDLISKLLTGGNPGKEIGIPQGLALSPTTFHLVLARTLKLEENTTYPTTATTLIYADNIVYIGENPEELMKVHDRHGNLLNGAGLRWKVENPRMTNLTTDQTELLGCKLAVRNGELKFRYTNEKEGKLKAELREMTTLTSPSRNAQSRLRGWCMENSHIIGTSETGEILGILSILTDLYGLKEIRWGKVNLAISNSRLLWQRLVDTPPGSPIYMPGDNVPPIGDCLDSHV